MATKVSAFKLQQISVRTTSIARGRADKNFTVSKLDLSKFIPGVTFEFGSVGSQIAG